ncbi:MAG: DUF1598 domain-containing protein [Planctomycetota bacterium]
MWNLFSPFKSGLAAAVLFALAASGAESSAQDFFAGPNVLPANDLGDEQDNGGNGAGGGALADFDSLMNLIQTTVEPTVWEALGGVSTMAPYPAGILVDPDGLIRESSILNMKSITAAARAASMRASIRQTALGQSVELSDELNWRDATSMRCVSLRRLLQTLTAVELDPKASLDDDAVDHLAGLSEVKLVVVTPDDVVLAGPVGGFVDYQGWQVDTLSGRPPIRLTSLAIGCWASRHDQPFGCTIDPTTQGLQNAAIVGDAVSQGSLAIGQAAGELAGELGRQDVKVFGTPANHEVAWLMIEADRHMKQLALGQQSMPDGTRNFAETVQAESPNQPPSDLLLRLWFTGQPLSIRRSVDTESSVVELSGQPLRLSGENELALQSGERGRRVIDPATESFVNHFNDHWASIRSAYPLYGALESLYRGVAIAQLWHALAQGTDHEVMQRGLMHFASRRAKQLQTPRSVDSIAIMHRYQHRRRIHHLVLASGGVSIAPTDLVGDIRESPSLANKASLTKKRPPQRWWWNVAL